jgi:hypothetical protein
MCLQCVFCRKGLIIRDTVSAEVCVKAATEKKGFASGIDNMVTPFTLLLPAITPEAAIFVCCLTTVIPSPFWHVIDCVKP